MSKNAKPVTFPLFSQIMSVFTKDITECFTHVSNSSTNIKYYMSTWITVHGHLKKMILIRKKNFQKKKHKIMYKFSKKFYQQLIKRNWFFNLNKNIEFSYSSSTKKL